MIAATSSWARPESEPMPVKVDDVGTQYHNVAPPAGVRAEDGVMGGGADFIKPVCADAANELPANVRTPV